MSKTILSDMLFAGFFLVVSRFLVFRFLFLYFFFLPAEVILPAFLFPIKSHVTSAVFLTTHLEAVFATCISVFVTVSINFVPYISPNFPANDKKPYPSNYFLYCGLDIERLGWCPVGSVLPHGEKVPL